ncbi:MAG: hypothetical protein KAG20_11150 [Cocleimonas sp.]|nr:hypothetical protein [Cocleimonas sp.]
MKKSVPIVQHPSEIQRYQEDEVSLHDILIVIRKKKKTIIVVMIICTFFAVVYALLITPTYKAKATFFPPSSKDVVAYNASVLRIMPSNVSIFSEASKEQLFATFRVILSSAMLKKQIFKQFELHKAYKETLSENEAISRYFKSYLITAPAAVKKNKDRLVAPYRLTLEGENPEQIATLLNTMIEVANKKATVEIREEIKIAVDSKILALRDEIKVAKKESISVVNDQITRLREADDILKSSLKHEIKMLKEYAKKQKMDRIKRLEEAASIAHQIGLIEPFSSTQAEFKIELPSKQSEKNKSLYALGQKPLYYLGEKAIRAELNALNGRVLDDPFIVELRDLEQKLALLKQNHKIEALINRKNNDAYIKVLRAKTLALSGLLAIDMQSISIKTVMVDQSAYAPTNKIKPKRSLIVAIGATMGLMLGLFLALFLAYLEKNPVVEG